MAMTVKLYVTDECGPCSDVKTAIEQNNYEMVGVAKGDRIKVIDMTADDGFILDEDLSSIPAATYKKRECKIFINEDTLKVTIDCTKD
tara:strand:+ start:926 stop:1189 length:264 start_codon:yes stop_codon:yes gene_type:complete